MIDWLDITIPLIHRPLEQGAYIVVEHDGTVRRESTIKRVVEGSYCSSIGVASVSQSVNKAIHALPTRLAPVVFPSADISLGYVSHLHFSGNPTKYLQGHNCFGSDCLQTLACRMVADVMPKLGFCELMISRAIKAIKDFDYQVSRIDITRMYSLGTDADVDDYLFMLPSTVKARGDRVSTTHGTVYVGKNSTLWSFKFYNKYKELLSRSKHHSLPIELRGCGIEEFVRGQLRVELVLRKKALERLGMTNPKLLSESVDKLFNEHAGKIEMTNQAVNEKRILELSNAYQGTFQLWKQGFNLRTHLSKPTFYRHRAVLLDYGIDIALPPIDKAIRRAKIEPFVKHLKPVEVNVIPSELQRYLVQRVA